MTATSSTMRVRRTGSTAMPVLHEPPLKGVDEEALLWEDDPDFKKPKPARKKKKKAAAVRATTSSDSDEGDVMRV